MARHAKLILFLAGIALLLLEGGCARRLSSARLSRCADCPTTLDACLGDPATASAAQCAEVAAACRQACGPDQRAPAPASYLAVGE